MNQDESDKKGIQGVKCVGLQAMVEPLVNGYLAEPKNIHSLIEGIEWAVSSSKSYRNCHWRPVNNQTISIA